MKFKWIEHVYVIVIHILLKTRKILTGSRWRSSLWRWHGDLGWHLSSEPSWKRWSWISSSCEPSITILWNTLEPCTKRHNFRKSKVTFFCEVLNDACWDTYMGFIIPSPKGLNAVAPVGFSVDFTSQGLDYHPYLFAPRKWPNIFGVFFWQLLFLCAKVRRIIYYHGNGEICEEYTGWVHLYEVFPCRNLAVKRSNTWLFWLTCFNL